MPLQSPIAPSVIIARKHNPPIRSTAREGSANPLLASEWADTLPSRLVIHSAATQSAIPTSRLSSRGATPAAAAIATRPADRNPPTLQPPCIEDVAGQGHRDERARGHAQQAQPKRRLRDPEVDLQPRDVRDPRSHHRAVD